jgi:hypothetical protein
MRTAITVLAAAVLTVLTVRGTFGPAADPAVWLLAGFLFAVVLCLTGRTRASREGH